jgi:MFS family permease
VIARNVRGLLLLNTYFVPINLQSTALMTIAVPAAVRTFPGDHVHLYAALASAAAAMAMVVPPFAGAISDRLRSRGVNRRPMVIVGAALNFFALLWMMYATSAPQFSAALMVAVLGQSVSLAAYQALIPDVVAPQAWGTASGYQGAAALIGSVGGLLLASIAAPAQTFLGSAIVLAAGCIAVAFTPEPERQPVEHEHAEIKDWHDFIIVFWSRCWTNFGLALLMTFVLYFFSDVLKVSKPSAATGIVGGMALLGAIVTSVVMGIASDKMVRKHVVALAGIPMAVAAIGFAVVPSERWIMGFALLFGLGYGAFVSTGWAIAIDSVPQLRDVARDLGIWGIASNLPSVVAPVAGGWLLAQFAQPLAAYRALFIAAGFSFALASAIVLLVGERRRFGLCFQAFALGMASPYFHLAYRIRAWGRLPKKRGATLVICNHQHDLDTTAVVTRLILDGPWYEPIYAAGSRRMFEPGFMGFRTRWLRSLLRRADWSGLFGAIGVLPIENELRRRTLASFAATVERAHGDLVLGDVFDESALAPYGAGIAKRRISFLADSSVFVMARHAPMMIEHVRQPYRGEILARMRVDLDCDLQRIERTLRSGKTFYLTPEGRYSTDGRMSRVRTTLSRLAPLATVYLSAVSYDVFVGRRLSMLFQIVSPIDSGQLGQSLAAARPITTSQLIADWLTTSPTVITVADAVGAVKDRVAALPPRAFVDPELKNKPTVMASAALAGLVRLCLLDTSYKPTANRRHPQFPGVTDIVAHQANQFAETIVALRALGDQKIEDSPNAS